MAERELSFRAVVLGALLSALLSAANAYLGLFAGMTVSASIPAAVVSMGLLRAVRGSLLENNIVQTAASAGESVAAGAIFTLPALVLLGAWHEFDYLWTVVLVGSGGLLGVVFTIPLRRALIVSGDLPFPEGVATAEVLKAGHTGSGGPGLAVMVGGGVLGGLAKLLEGGFGLIRPVLEGGRLIGGRVIAGGCGVSPALLAVGYIVGFNVALLVLLGGLINWMCVLPFTAEVALEQMPLEAAWSAWSASTRYLGVGAMTVGGLGAVFQLRSKLGLAAGELLSAVGIGRAGKGGLEKGLDLSGASLMAILGVSLLVLLVAFSVMIGFGVPSIALVVLVLLTGFVFCAVAGYMAGLVGSSNNPVSGVTIATILITSLTLLFLGMQATAPATGGFSGPAAAILVGTAVCTAAAIGGDTMQDLKAGHLLGASPWKQQVAQIVGVLAATLVLAPVLQLLLDVHGFGAPTELHPRPLRAPQATLMAAVASGVFGGTLPLDFAALGAAVAIGFFALDAWLARRGSKFRTPPLAVAVGLYLPLELSVPVALGGLVAFFVERRKRERAAPERVDLRLGLLLGAGLITGEALLGIGLAAWAGVRGSVDSLKWGPAPSDGGALLLILVVLAALGWAGSQLGPPLDERAGPSS